MTVNYQQSQAGNHLDHQELLSYIIKQSNMKGRQILRMSLSQGRHSASVFITYDGPITTRGKQATKLPIHPAWYNAFAEAYSISKIRRSVSLAFSSQTLETSVHSLRKGMRTK
jgi:hypothetical protein